MTCEPPLPAGHKPRSADLRSCWSRWAVLGLPVLLAVAVLWGSPNYERLSGPEAEPFGGDFLQEWTGGWMLRQGDRSQFYDPVYISRVEHDVSLVGFEWDTNGYLPMVYPPFWYLLVSPLSLLPMTTGAVVWLWLMTAALVGALWLLRPYVRGSLTGHSPPSGSDHHLAGAGTHNAVGVLILPALVLYVPLIESLGSGQKGTLLLLLFTATFVLLDRQRPFLAGMVFGLVAFKPQLTLVIGFAMLFKRQWTFIAGGIVSGVVLVGLSLATGGDLCLQFFDLCRGMGNYVQTSGYDLHKAHCWWGACQLMLDGAPAGIVKTCAAAGSLLTICLLVSMLRGPLKFSTPEFARQFSALVIATLLLSPHLFTYDLTLLLFPLLMLTCTDAALAAGNRWLPIALFVVAGLSADIAQASGVQISVWMMVGLLGTLVFQQRSLPAARFSSRCYGSAVAGR